MTQVGAEQGIVAGSQKNGVFQFRCMPYAAPPVSTWG
jgi:carboxylesterase type B